MGGCCCRNRNALLMESPTITIKARVGDIGIGTAHVSLLRSQACCDPVMFVSGNTLRYTGCYVYGTRLQSVTNIEVVDDGYALIGGRHLVLRPGLKISLQDGSMIAVAVPEAYAFAEMLRTVVPCYN